MVNPRDVLIVAHPGHELLVHGWLCRSKPLCLVLTDGSGGQGVPRIDRTREILRDAGAEAGAIMGPLADQAAYEGLLRHDHGMFCSLAFGIASELVRVEALKVVTDAIEGYNPMHDVCGLLAAAAVRIVRRVMGFGHASFNLSFSLVGPSGARLEDLPLGSVVEQLDEERFRRKLDAARRYRELAPEVERMLNESGVEPFRREVLTRVMSLGSAGDGLPEAKPFYETFGERRAQEGRYREVVRRREHILPLAETLWGIR